MNNECRSLVLRYAGAASKLWIRHLAESLRAIFHQLRLRSLQLEADERRRRCWERRVGTELET